MELRHIRYFIALAEKLSFTQAAKQMHVTQSTLSHQIKQLEEELGVVLFSRQDRHVELTAAGQMFLGSATSAVSQLDGAMLQIKQPGRELRGQVRVAAPASLAMSMFPQSLAAFFTAHPGINVRIEEIVSMDEIQRRLIEETLDIGLLYPPLISDELVIEPLYEEQVMLLVRTDHPLAKRRKVRLIDLQGQRMCMPLGRLYRQVLEGFLHSVGAEPKVVLEVDGFGSIPSIISQTAIAAFVPAHAVPPTEGLCMIPIERPVPTRVPSMCLKRNRKQDPAVGAFAAAIRQLSAARGR